MVRDSIRHSPGWSARLGIAGLARLWLIASLSLVAVSASSLAQEESGPEPALQARLAGKSLLLDAFAVDDAFVVVGGRGHVLVSTDGGDSWRQAEVPTRRTLTAVFFHDRNLGWAVGHDAAILRTTDGGISWELVHWAPEEESPLFDVWFSDADNGFAVGAYGSFYRTTDGGSSWVLEPISEWDFHLHHIARAADGRLYIAAEAGMIYRSDDEGDSWIELPSPYEGSFFGSLPLNGDTVLVFGLQGHLYRSEDAGETWAEIATDTTVMLTDGIRLADGTIVIGGLGGTLLVSSDGGAEFDLVPQADRRGIVAIVEGDAGELLMVGEFGVRVVGKDVLAR